MLSFLKNFFTAQQGVASKEDTTMFAKIEQVPYGFALTNRSGETVQTYSRRRDAVRGAQRRGLIVE